MANIKIYGVLVNDTTEGIVTRADQILDSNLGKTQETINKEVYDLVGKFKDPSISYDDTVTKDSQNAVQSRGIFKFVDDATSHMPYVGDDGYVYVWDLELGEYKRTGTNLTGPAGETGGTVHLIFETTLLRVNNLGQMYPSSPLRVRVIKQYGETGLDPYKDGCVKWWFNGIEDENKPDGWIGWSESGDEEYGEIKGVASGTDMSEFSVPINSDHHDTITFVLYIDKAGTKAFDQQNIFVIRDPAMYKLDLTNENSMVPMCDENGNVDDAYFETSQAILYHGAEQVPFEDITYSVLLHEGLDKAEINEEGIITVSGWKTEWSVVNVQVCAEYAGNKFYATYSITRVSGITIYRLQPSVTNIKKHKDGTFSADSVFANVFRVEASNSGGVSSKIDSYAAEGLKVLYTYNNKVETLDDIYELANTEESIPVHGDNLPSTLDGDVSEIDIYVVKASQPITTSIDLFIDHETVPVVEDGDDGFMVYLSNESSTVNCKPDGTQVGSLWNTQAVLMKGIEDYSDKCDWSFTVEPANGLSSAPTWAAQVPGYLQVAGCVMNKNIDQVSIYITATYPKVSGNKFTKAYTITKTKQGEVGESGFKSSVFVRTNKVPDRPLSGASGGTYEKPVPTHYATSGGEVITRDNGEKIKWTDGVPTNSDEAIWMSSRLFTTAGIEQESEWTDPVQMTDTATFNVEFTWFDPYIGDPDTNPDEWFDPVEDADVFREHSMVYMATQHLSNGEPIMHESQDGSGNETSWTIVRVLGEKGETALQSLIFARCEKQPQTPEGGDIENPMPDPNPALDGTTWYDGIPGGDPFHPVWMSSRVFSTLKGVGTNVWTEPQILRDVPGQYDVEYSTVYENPGTPSDNPGNWMDPDDMTPEQQSQVWWLAQRWCGLEWSEDGINPGWSPWDVLKIRGEDGKDGSKAVPRMRGDWEEDIGYGDWILCGYTHTDVNATGATITVTEEYQDLVYRTSGETQHCYKCLISHKKSDAYDPGLAQYVYDEGTQSYKSNDGYWLRAEQYEFLSTRLLNAEKIISEIISTSTLIVPGTWEKDKSGNGKTVQTQVVTENGSIEFKYRYSEGESWRKSVEIGYDFTQDSGILVFYAADGVTPLYNLGPKGLAASVINSASINDKETYWSDYYDGGYYYRCNGVFFEKEERANLYDSETGTIPTLSLGYDDCAGFVQFLQGKNRFYSHTDPKYRYKLLKHGSSTVHMSLGFTVINPLTGEAIDYDDGTPAGYPSGNPVIYFSGNTIGHVGIDYPTLKYQDIKFSFTHNGIEGSYGTLTYPVRHWSCVYVPMTDITDVASVNSDYVEANKTFSITFGANTQLINGRWIGQGDPATGPIGSGWYSRYDIVPDKCSSKILHAAIGDLDTSDFMDYFTFVGDGESPLMSTDDCCDILTEALKIVKQVIYVLVRGTAYGVCCRSQNIISYWIETGLQRCMQTAMAGNVLGNLYLSSHLIAKKLLEAMINDRLISDEDSYGIVLGYVFPQDKYFKYEDSKLTLTSCDPIKVGTLFSEGVSYYSDANGFEGIYAPQEGTKNRGYLMINSVSGTIGGRDSSISTTPIGNTYKITAYSELTEEGKNIHVTLKYEPVPYFTAFLEEGKCSMPSFTSPLVSGSFAGWNIEFGIKNN